MFQRIDMAGRGYRSIQELGRTITFAYELQTHCATGLGFDGKRKF